MNEKNLAAIRAAALAQDAALLDQGASMLEALARDERNRGNDSAAMGAECSAHAVRRLAAAMLVPCVGLSGELLEIAAEQRDPEARGCSFGPEEIARACELAAWNLNCTPPKKGAVDLPFPNDPILSGYGQ